MKTGLTLAQRAKIARVVVALPARPVAVITSVYRPRGSRAARTTSLRDAVVVLTST